ncbi:MAG: AEC family transporter [Leptospira sp.]|nr:AEC family transporter [Leptospira sp.]
MSNFYLLIVCFVLGVIFKRISVFPINTPKVLSSFIMYVSLPALVLYHVHELKLSGEIVYLALMPWIVFFVALLIFYTFFKLKKINYKVAICLVLTAGLGNTSFVGFPLLEFYLGKESLGYAIIADQLGTFLVLSFPGIILATTAEEGKWSISFLLKRVVRFIPIYALIFAFLFRPFEYDDHVKVLLLRLGDTLTPLALVSVGFLLDIKKIKGFEWIIFYGLFYKLILSPLLLFFLFKPIGLSDLVFKTLILEAGMAPMVTSSIVAIEKDIEPELAALMLGIGIPLSFISTAVLSYLLNLYFGT